MKLTELIDKLNEVQQAHGEMDVFFYDRLEEHTSNIYGKIWTGTAENAKDEFYDAGDSDITLSDISNNTTVLVLR